VLDLIATAAGVSWRRPLAEVAAEALAFIDGVTLRWLVDGNSVAAVARLSTFAAHLAASLERRPSRAAEPIR
jgi:hypothetical protein